MLPECGELGSSVKYEFIQLAICYPLTLFRWGDQTCPLTSPVTSTNVGVSPQNLLNFSFNSFATLVETFKAISSASPKLLNFNQVYPSKNWFFWSNPYKNEVMMIFLIEMLELPSFGYMNASAKFDSHDKTFLVTSLTKIWRHVFYFKIPLF